MKKTSTIGQWILLLGALASPVCPGATLLHESFDSPLEAPKLWNSAGAHVKYEDSILKLETNQTDDGGRIWQIGSLPVQAGVIRISRKVRVQKSRDNSMPAFNVYRGAGAFTDDKLLFSLRYASMTFNGANHRSVHGLFLAPGTSNPHSRETHDQTTLLAEVRWNEWIEEQIIIDTVNSTVEIVHDEESLGVHSVPLPRFAQLRLSATAWGWWTGQEHYIDDLQVDQLCLASPPSDPHIVRIWNQAHHGTRMLVSGPIGRSIEIERSTTLENWSTQSTHVIPESGCLVLSLTSPERHSYYRIKWTRPLVLFSDDFQDGHLDPAKWEILRNESSRIAEESEVMKVETTQTDRPGTLSTKPITIPTDRAWTLRRKVLLHRDTSRSFQGGNKFYLGFMTFHVPGNEPFGVWYCDYDYQGDRAPLQSTHGFVLVKNGASGHEAPQDGNTSGELAPLIVDRWFNERIHFDPATGLMKYSVNGKELGEIEVGELSDVGGDQTMTIQFQSYGWWSPHWQHFDDLIIESSP